VFDCGRLKVEDPVRFNFKKEDLKTLDLSVGCYLIAHPKGTLMWDTGVIPDDMFKPGVTTPALQYATTTKPLKAQLAAAGYDPKDITYLAFSHYHWDHIGNGNMFASSTWLARQNERDMMLAGTSDSRYPDHFSLLKNAKTTVIETNRDEYDVFGDGTVIIKSTPGHTPGHQVLFVKLKKSPPVVLAGDLYHYPEEIGTKITPANDVDKAATLKSRENLDAFMKQHKAQLWIQHDLAAFEKLRKGPQFYE
jgi:glyoxylase-like metal-dependent hydrolase (beta-lactamase superfamily II)